jgi:N-acetylglucosaminyl-diphospho-decaprenol L-rhamnosyltransferase
MEVRPNPRVRLGVVLYQNGEAELERLTRSIEANRTGPGAPTFEVAWLDNSPGPALHHVLARLDVEPGYHHAGKNLGFGAGHNVLMREAFERGAEYYICVNPDAVLHPACLQELVRVADHQPVPGLVEALQFPDEHPKPYDLHTHVTSWCSGCVLLISRAVHRRVGGFDERFFMYCEDVDLSWRARAAGFSTVVAPRALVHHYTGDRAPGGGVAAHMLRSGAYLGAKYGSEAFLELCLGEYRAHTGSALPRPAAPAPTEALRRVADFDHLFHFAEARW